VVLCAAGYNLRWLLRVMARFGLKALLLRTQAILRTGSGVTIYPASATSLGVAFGGVR
jgi:hypothetical protein